MALRLALPLLAAAALSTVGCYTTWDIAPRNVGSLHVDQESGDKVIIANNGDFVVVDRNTELVFRSSAPRASMLDVKFESVGVVGGPAEPRKEWWLGGVLRGDGRGIRVDMNQVTSLAAKRYSPGKTTALVVGAVAAACVVAGVAGGIIASQISN